MPPFSDADEYEIESERIGAILNLPPFRPKANAVHMACELRMLCRATPRLPTTIVRVLLRVAPERAATSRSCAAALLVYVVSSRRGTIRCSLQRKR